MLCGVPRWPLRRQWLLAQVLWLMGVLGSPAQAQTPPLLQFQAVSPSWYVLYGSDETLTESIDGRIANVALVVKSGQALIIGSGVSFQHGQAIVQAAKKITGKRRLSLLLTHAQAEFIMGAAAFERANIAVQMPVAARVRMQERCGVCLQNLTTRYGVKAMQGSRVLARVQAPKPFAKLQFIDHGLNSSAGMSVYDPEDDVHFLAGLYSPARVPELQEASPLLWRQALAGVKAKHLIPGHGPLLHRLDWSYFDHLYQQVEAHLDAGGSLAELLTLADSAAHSGWKNYPLYHRRNLSQWFLKREAESF
ncbi:MAG: hypothetical protein RLZZ502_1831 [Pseudomonadota bacterium]|jgi:glyoxylase-like metal-dependent hydrolase (beta-lactamase superfamily II)